LAPILIEAPKRAIKFASNEQYINMLRIFKGSKQLSNNCYVLSGVLAGITEAFVVVSMELVKVRMQSSQSVFLFLIFKVNLYNNVLDCIYKVFKYEGPGAFFKGLESTVWRHAMWNGGYFGSINPIKGQLTVWNVLFI
jgi:solute carrier family 25 (mitochondrial 2-oxodicarboxylate transporter), member 21